MSIQLTLVIGQFRKPDELWHCTHTKKCRWVGHEEELIQIPYPKLHQSATRGVCPRCGNESFYVRPKCGQPKEAV